MTEGKTADPRTRSADALAFDLILVTFVGAVVVLSLTRLTPGARLVPLIIGVPTLVGVTAQLLLDLFPGVRPRLGRKSAPHRDVDVEDEPDESDTVAARRRVTRRNIVFSAWAVGFFLLTAAFGFLVSIPIALFFFFRVVAREGWVLTLSVTVGAWAFVWLLFGVLLNVEL